MINITDTDQELLLMAAETIRLYCKAELCTDCLFENHDEHYCILKSSIPADWRLNCDKES